MKFQEQMIARVPARGKAEVETFRRQPVEQAEHFQPVPAPKTILMLYLRRSTVR
jgi:hypothetical protein